MPKGTPSIFKYFRPTREEAKKRTVLEEEDVDNELLEIEEDNLDCVSRLKSTSRRGEASSCAASWCWRCAASSRPSSPRTGDRLSRSRCNDIIMNLPTDI